MKKFCFFTALLCIALFAANAGAAINFERFRQAAKVLTQDENNLEQSVDNGCGEGEFKKGNECVPCTFALPNCLKCATSAACIQCAPGYQRTQTGKCRKSGCDDAVVNGKKHPQIKINGVCSFACKDGKNCAACDIDGLCTKCVQGYKLSEDKLTCNDCPEHCSACNGKTCTKCEGGYTLLDGRCFEGTVGCPEGTVPEENGCCLIAE